MSKLRRKKIDCTNKKDKDPVSCFESRGEFGDGGSRVACQGYIWELVLHGNQSAHIILAWARREGVILISLSLADDWMSHGICPHRFTQQRIVSCSLSTVFVLL